MSTNPERRQVPFLNFKDPELVDKMVALAVEAHQLVELKSFCEALGQRLAPDMIDEERLRRKGIEMRQNAQRLGRPVPQATASDKPKEKA